MRFPAAGRFRGAELDDRTGAADKNSGDGQGRRRWDNLCPLVCASRLARHQRTMAGLADVASGIPVSQGKHPSRDNRTVRAQLEQWVKNATLGTTVTDQ